MKFLKMETGWKGLEDDSFYKFGQMTINTYNWYHEENEKYLQLTNERKLTPEEEAYYNNLREEAETFMGFIEPHISEVHYGLFSPIRNYSPIDSKFHSKEEQEENHYNRVTLAKSQGWRDIGDGQDFSSMDLYLMNIATHLPPFQATSHFINGKWYMAYDTEDTNKIVFLDMQEIRNCNYDFIFCKHCGKIFIRNKKNKKYCSDLCSEKHQKEYEKNRTSTPRGKNHRVITYMNNSGKFSDSEINDFLDESNYYWDVIKGKKPKNSQNYRSDICTQNQYLDWLEKKHTEFKAKEKPITS